MKYLWPDSATGRLALLFAIVAILTYASLGSYLYYSLAKELERHDDLELIGKVALVRHLLVQTPSSKAIPYYKHVFLDAVVGHHGLILQLHTPTGRIVLSNSPASPSLPVTPVVPVRREPTFDDVQDWTPGKETGRVLRALGETARGPGDAVQIVLGLKSEERTALLASYSKTLAIAVTAGAALAAMLGYFAARAVLRPIRIYADKANTISAARLQSRLPMDNVPTEFRALATSFNSMFDRLEEGVQRLSNFAADLAHDLRTPINNLMVQTQVAMSKPRMPSDYQSLLESNYEEYERLAQLIENTLFLARAEQAQLGINQQPIEVRAELQRIGQYFEGLAEEHDIRIVVESPDITLHADRVLFQRAVSNLVSNAVRHTPSGGVVHVRARADEDRVQVLVENTGESVPPNEAEKIFERFYRGAAVPSTRAGAAGLGLAIVRAIMKLHGGEVTLNSTEAKTTLFTLSFKA